MTKYFPEEFYQINFPHDFILDDRQKRSNLKNIEKIEKKYWYQIITKEKFKILVRNVPQGFSFPSIYL